MITKNPGRDMSLEDRFWKNVKIGAPNECWPWIADAAPAGRHLPVREPVGDAHQGWQLA